MFAHKPFLPSQIQSSKAEDKHSLKSSLFIYMSNPKKCKDKHSSLFCSGGSNKEEEEKKFCKINIGVQSYKNFFTAVT